MKKHLSSLVLASFSLLGALGLTSHVAAQVAGEITTVDVNVAESTQSTKGWSVKKTLMGKTIYNDVGQQVGTVEDLIISPDRNVSYVIIGAGGFVGIGQHDVAIPVNQIEDRGGRLVMPGATKDGIKNMPKFAYVTDTGKREQFIASADRDIAKGKVRITDLQKRAGEVSADAKVKIDQQIVQLQADIKSAEARLSDMKKATAARWKEFEAGVNMATARLRKSIDSDMPS